MTSRQLHSKFSSAPGLALLAVIAVTGCSDRAVGPADFSRGAATLEASTARSDAGGCSKKQMTVDVRAFLESSGDVTIEVTSPPGTSIEKIKVKLYDVRGKHAGELEFNKIPANTGSASVTIPASKGVQQGWTASVTVHVRGCRDKESEAVRSDVTVTRRFDLSVGPILMAAANPGEDFPLQDAQVGVPTLYDVTISNTGGRDVEASCNVLVDGIALPATAQYWVDGSGATIGVSGAPLLIAAGTAQICRFSVTYTTEGTHELVVSTAAVGGGEINLSNNSTSATITTVPAGNAPLVKFQWFLQQREAVNVAADRSVTSTGLISQTATINTYFEETLDDVPGTDTWTFTVTSSTEGGTFDSKTATVVTPRITQSVMSAHVAEFGPDVPLCQLLLPRATSATRAYLSNDVTLCAFAKPGDPTKVTMQLNHRVSSGDHSDAPYTGTDLLLWGATFSYFAEVQHTGAAGTNTFGGLTKTVTLSPPIFEEPLVTGPNVRFTSFSQLPE